MINSRTPEGDDMSQFCVFLLMLNAAYVAYGLSRRRNMWLFIVLYWIILTIKNYIDFVGIVF